VEGLVGYPVYQNSPGKSTQHSLPHGPNFLYFLYFSLFYFTFHYLYLDFTRKVFLHIGPIGVTARAHVSHIDQFVNPE
jgi:hypothetical protein